MHPVISNVNLSQRAGTKLVGVSYDLMDSDTAALTVSAEISGHDGADWTVPATTTYGAIGGGVSPCWAVKDADLECKLGPEFSVCDSSALPAYDGRWGEFGVGCLPGST